MLGQKESRNLIFICLIIVILIRRTISSYSCPSLEKAAVEYVACESRATQYFELYCYPEELLGFKDSNYNISWAFNGELMTWPMPYRTRSFKKKTYKGDILVSESTSPRDVGNYTCVVTSSNGTTVNRTINLCVTISDDLKEKPFDNEKRPIMASKVMPGVLVSFRCNAFVGIPKCLNPFNYTIYWWKMLGNGTRLFMKSSSDVEITKFLKGGEMSSVLAFKNVRKEHFGTYECVVTNAYGEFRVNATLEFGVNDGEYLALQYKAVIIIVIAMCIFILVAVCVCWRYRNDLALYYTEKTFDSSVAGGYLYDVFVIHGETASRWVWEILQSNLEDVYGYKCFLPQRDLVGGEDIIDAISKTIPKCLRVIVVITPCLMRDHWSAWAIHHAYKAAMNTPTRIIPLVLQDIKEKQDYPDPHGILDILKILMAKKVRVPFVCQLNESEKKLEVVKAEEKNKSREDEIKTSDFKLKLPVGNSGSLRSRSKSPKNQRVMNMISASEEPSKDILDDQCVKTKSTLKGEEKGHHRKGRGGKPLLGFQVKYEEEEEEEEEEPGSPCSITPFIFRRKSATQLDKEKFGTCLWRYIKIMFAGDEKQLFWQTMRLRLSPPLSCQLARMKNKRGVGAEC